MYRKILVTERSEEVKVAEYLEWKGEGIINIYIADKFDGFDVDLTFEEALELSKMLKEAVKIV